MSLTKHYAEKIRSIIKTIHDEKLYNESEITEIIRNTIIDVKKEVQNIEELTIMAFIIQYLYFSDTFNKYFFNTKRKAKEKEYHSIVHRQVILTIDKDPINEIVHVIHIEENKVNKVNNVNTNSENSTDVITIVLSDTPPKPKEPIILYKYPIDKCIHIKHIETAYSPFGTSWYHDIQFDDVWDNYCLKMEKQFDILRAIKSPDQRTPGWYAERDGKITASDGGTVLDENHYEPQYKFILKKTVGLPFLANEFVHHGKKHEENATKIYEYRMNVSTDEFGLIGHSKYTFLGASPDRICNKFKLDGVHRSKFIGRMLEIKCPLVRQIKTSGDIIDHICPKYYWIQV